VTVEDDGHVTGFISRFGDGESDKGAFLDQFFKTGNLRGTGSISRLRLSTECRSTFKGTVERGDGKSPGDESYFVLRGTLSRK